MKLAYWFIFLDEFTQIGRLVAVFNFMGHQGNFIVYPCRDGKPVQFCQNGLNVITLPCAGDYMCKRVLHPLKFRYVVTGRAT